MSLFCFYSAQATRRRTYVSSLRSAQTSDSIWARLVRLLDYNSLKFRNFYSQRSKVCLCLSIFFYVSLSYSAKRVNCYCAVRHQQLFRENYSPTRRSFSWEVRIFSQSNFSSQARQKTLRSYWAFFYSRVLSLMESSLTLDYSCESRACFVVNSFVVDWISSLRPFTISLQFLNSSKKRQNSQSSLYFLANYAYRDSYFSCRAATRPQQCYLSFLSIMIRRRYSPSTNENLYSMLAMDSQRFPGVCVVSCACFECFNADFYRQSSLHWSQSYWAYDQNCYIILDRSFSKRFFYFLCLSPISFRLAMTSIRDFSPRNSFNRMIRYPSACSPKIIEVRVYMQKSMPLLSQKKCFRCLQLISFPVVPQSRWERSACSADSSFDWANLSPNTLKTCAFSRSLPYSPSLLFSSCRRLRDYSRCWLISSSFLSASLTNLANLPLPSSLICPFSSC